MDRIYNGIVKMNSGMPETRPRIKASERFLTDFALRLRHCAILREMKSSVPEPFRK